MENKKIFDLATGELCRYPFEAPDTFTYDPEADCPRWEQFIDEVTCGNKQMATFLQRMVGYCMTKDTREQCMFYIFGAGSNGKSTFTDTIAEMLGDDNVVRCLSSSVMCGNDSRATSADVARFKDARLVVAEEPSRECKMDESTIKRMTDGGRIIVRPLYGQALEISANFKIILTRNYLPQIKEVDSGIFRRIRMVPFYAQFSTEQRDTSLSEKLRRELPGIFNWALEGAAEWYQHGLPATMNGK